MQKHPGRRSENHWARGFLEKSLHRMGEYEQQILQQKTVLSLQYI
jgi:hypothetical protein